MPANIGYATKGPRKPLRPYAFDRNPVGPQDVRIQIRFCGVCRSDIHQARDEWGGPLATHYPWMPGHEIVGIVAEVGGEVRAHAVGDRVGVGCMIYWGAEDQRGKPDEQYQNPPAVFTYNAVDEKTGEITFGGYSDEIVVNEHFVLRIPDAIPLEKAAPILCAGVTTWSPLRHWEIGAGHVVGVAGIGGLGHMAVQLAKARGAQKVVALTTTADKRDEALRLGADEVVVMSEKEQVEAHAASFDFILSTIPEAFDMKPYLSMVKHDGTLVTVGTLVPTPKEAIDLAAVSMTRVRIAGSMIGSIAETQEVLDFCAEHGIASDVQVIPIDQINEAFEQVVAKEARFRYVIDNSTLPSKDQ
ncbi:NAD(P)-dependent alcohol dehydrogenase [Longimicrobium terrae]|uniref:Putative zinc-type alcohol dehydrogenase-like protein n=1 Tax=Longimicrobium terrae TaxID=1639882 RepID=A0A841H3D7_9BACT|nr:NAD(P)-dependent alcohol dehydrogenase [Longimicrobium terrae]MBB4637795.1 putative zinc-type alcohol dehydrogenase-like protein [Longimicrobium terrae]MBB6072349.1 putative zinc-type alcohol dehydrogenase-like protein [Longimicrobium terrae]NNC31268.1 NAD(P)-dependent alcohol dehydrogenase [Longimicrobium terrae]